MVRLQPSVVPMSADDVCTVGQMWVQRRTEIGPSAESARRAVEEGRFAEAVGREHTVVLMAVLDGAPAGYVWLSLQPMAAQFDLPTLAIEDLYVLTEVRGQGVARALLTSTAAYAQKRGVDHIGCALPTQAKDSHRSLARLGFAAVVTRRVAQTGPLLRRLRGSESRSGGVDQLLLQRRRRAQRSRIETEALVAHS